MTDKKEGSDWTAWSSCTLLLGFSRPLWWMLHQRRPDGGRDAPRYQWALRAPGLLLLAAAAGVIVMSVTNSFVFQ